MASLNPCKHDDGEYVYSFALRRAERDGGAPCPSTPNTARTLLFTLILL